MKALKISLVLGLILAVGTYFNNSIAQTFENNESVQNDYFKITPRQNLVVTLLRQEIKNNPEFASDADSINYTLDFASERDIIAENCFIYSPLLVDAVNTNKSFSSYSKIQGNFGYVFKTKKDKTSTTFNFYSHYSEERDDIVLDTTILIQKGSLNYQIDGPKAIDYIVDNYCKPLNQILDQNSNRPIPQLLEILKQRFSK